MLIAVIDSEVDAAHPDLAGAIVANFEASADAEKPHSHGTGMAGAIAARRSMLGTAPRAGLLTVRAFSMRSDSAEGTTFNILKGLDWAAAQGARIINMSFAGPSDPRLREALPRPTEGHRADRGGRQCRAKFTAAVSGCRSERDCGDGDGRRRTNCSAVPIAATTSPSPRPASTSWCRHRTATYQFTTGTSVAAAEVSGVVALLIERNPSLKPDDVRKILMETAKDLGPKGRDREFGAGLVNALQAVMSARR